MNRRKIIHVSVEEFNEILKNKNLDKNGLTYRDLNKGEQIGFKHFLVDKITKIHLIFNQNYSYPYKPVEYIADKNNIANGSTITGMNAYMRMQKFYKTPEVNNKNTAPLNIAGIIQSNPRKKGVRGYAYGYDINSAFSWGQLQDQPDTTQPLGAGLLEKGQIGFLEPDTLVLKEGTYCDYRFPSMESPYKKFVEKYYTMKKNAKTPQEKQAAKDTLNLSIGYLQRKNCFVRVNIIGRCNLRILELIKKYKKNFLYCNTDSFVADCRIEELENDISNEIGSWKLEKEGNFVFTDSGYQWDKNTPSIRGAAKAWFSENFDIVNDKLDRTQELNSYKFNKKTIQLERTKNNEKNKKKN